jgi:hypothetical protein
MADSRLGGGRTKRRADATRPAHVPAQRRSRAGAAPRVVVGGTPAALVCADALGAAGMPVRWLAPERGIGRGFAPIPRDGRALQLGVRLLELGYEDDPTTPPLHAYEPGTSGHRPFARLIRAWTEELVGERLREIALPRVVLDGALHDDFLFTVDLSGIATALTPAERAEIAAQAAAAERELGASGVLSTPDGAAERELGAAGLLSMRDGAGQRAAGLPSAGVAGVASAADPLGDRTLADASEANHGATFHARLIEPLAEKFVPGGSETILAAWRRKAWLPLFWPRTVREAFAGEAPAFQPRRTFHELEPGGVGALIEALEQRIAGYASVERIPVGALTRIERDGVSSSDARAGSGANGRGGARIRLSFDGGHVEDACEPALGVPAAELHKADGIDAPVDRIRTVIAWIEADAQAIPEQLDLVHVLDPHNPVARVSTGSTTPDPIRRLLAVELRHDQPEETAAQDAVAGLTAAGLLKGGDPQPIHQGAMATLPVPSSTSRERLHAAHEQLHARELPAHLLGGALEPGADSLNEQIVQGLRAAEALRR